MRLHEITSHLWWPSLLPTVHGLTVASGGEWTTCWKNVRFSRRTWNVPFLVGGFIFSKKHVSKSITASCPKNFWGDKKTCWKPPPTSFFKSWSGLIPLNGGHLSPEKATYWCKQGHNLKNLVMVISDLKLSGRLKTQGRSSRILWWTACKKHVIQMDFYYTTWIYLYLITISIIFIIIVRHHYYHYHFVYRYTYNIYIYYIHIGLKVKDFTTMYGCLTGSW